jgi:hypothetical protein
VPAGGVVFFLPTESHNKSEPATEIQIPANPDEPPVLESVGAKEDSKEITLKV